MNRLPGFLATALVVLSLSVIPSGLVQAQYSCDTVAGTLSPESPSAELYGDEFCENSVTSNCFGAGNSISLALKPREGTRGAIVCGATQAKICIMDNDCEESLGTHDESGQTVTLTGPYPSDLRLVVTDSDAVLCGFSDNSALVDCYWEDPDLIFKSDFEIHYPNSFSDWTRQRCGACSETYGITKSARAALDGEYGLEALYDGTRTPAFLIDASPRSETRFAAKFAIRVTGEFKMVNNKKHDVLVARQIKNRDKEQDIKSVLNLRLQPAPNGQYKIAVFVRTDNNKFTNAGTATFKPGRWTRIDVDWKAASSPNARDGFVRLYKNTNLQKETKRLDNYSFRIDQIWLGQVSGLDAQTNGVVFYDNFEARRMPKDDL